MLLLVTLFPVIEQSAAMVSTLMSYKHFDEHLGGRNHKPRERRPLGSGLQVHVVLGLAPLLSKVRGEIGEGRRNQL